MWKIDRIFRWNTAGLFHINGDWNPDSYSLVSNWITFLRTKVCLLARSCCPQQLIFTAVMINEFESLLLSEWCGSGSGRPEGLLPAAVSSWTKHCPGVGCVTTGLPPIWGYGQQWGPRPGWWGVERWWKWIQQRSFALCQWATTCSRCSHQRCQTLSLQNQVYRVDDTISNNGNDNVVIRRETDPCTN